MSKSSVGFPYELQKVIKKQNFIKASLKFKKITQNFFKASLGLH